MSQEINLLDEEMEETKSPPKVATLLNQLAEQKKEQEEHKEHWNRVKRIVEALLFAASEPLSLKKIREVTDTVHPFAPRHLTAIIEELRKEYIDQQRSFRLEEIGGGYLLRTQPEYGEFLNLLYRNKRLEKLSHAATEVLAIIAYKQPITRPDIESIRGVDCTGITQTLLERELIEVVGRLEAPGRPCLYAVTPQFYKYFGINDLEDLPASKKITEARDEEWTS